MQCEPNRRAECGRATEAQQNFALRLGRNSDYSASAAAAKSLQSCLTLCDPIAAHQAPPSLGFSRQEHWSGLPLPSAMQENEK